MSQKENKTIVTGGLGSRRMVACLNCKAPVDVSANEGGSSVTCPNCLSPVVVPPDDQSPAATAITQLPIAPDTNSECARRKLGAYEVTAFLGKGGMGCVYKALDTSLQREVAIKELAPHLAQQQDLVERFLREARLVAQLNHENICDIYFLGVDGEKNVPFYAMEYVDGENLEQRLERQGPLGIAAALDAIMQTTIALKVALEKGMIHRDIKPANIMITSDGIVKVTDFGLAKLMEGGQNLTQANVIMGTPHYMSPEAARGEACDFRSDIYSLGATLFHILTGKMPFDGPTAMAVLHKHINSEIPDISSICSNVPKNVEELVKKMLAKDASTRFSSYGELLKALTKLGAKPRSISRSSTNGQEKNSVDPGMDRAVFSMLGKSGVAIGEAGKKAMTVAKTLAPRISIKRRWKLKIGLSLLILFLSWLFLFGNADMILIPGGSYVVGSKYKLRPVKLDPFFIDIYEVTNAKYNEVLNLEPPPVDIAELPKIVDTEDVVAVYLAASGLSLPTDEQWQAAARGPSGQAYPWGPATDDDDFTNEANIYATDLEKPAEVGEYGTDCSPFGCYDMAGNVRETTCGDMTGVQRKYKTVNSHLGAGFNSRINYDSCAINVMDSRSLYYGYNDLGFRCVKNAGFFSTLFDWTKKALVGFFILALCLFL